MAGADLSGMLLAANQRKHSLESLLAERAVVELLPEGSPHVLGVSHDDGVVVGNTLQTHALEMRRRRGRREQTLNGFIEFAIESVPHHGEALSATVLPVSCDRVLNSICVANDALFATTSDLGRHSVLRFSLESGLCWHIAGLHQGFADGRGELARFNEPQMLARAADGTLFVCDSGNSAVRVIAPFGRKTAEVSTLTGGPELGGLDRPVALALSRDQRRVFVGELSGALRVIDLDAAESGAVRTILSESPERPILSIAIDGAEAVFCATGAQLLYLRPRTSHVVQVDFFGALQISRVAVNSRGHVAAVSHAGRVLVAPFRAMSSVYRFPSHRLEPLAMRLVLRTLLVIKASAPDAGADAGPSHGGALSLRSAFAALSPVVLQHLFGFICASERLL
eukprot:a842021_47.p1 GENE.a842021_47~~a842021_47.p1  ORF type:complete len:431 (-),score=108.88 a842021_47:783-1970(-)